MVVEAKDKVIRTMEAKFESFERRIEIMEADIHSKDLEIQRLQKKNGSLRETKQHSTRATRIDRHKSKTELADIHM